LRISRGKLRGQGSDHECRKRKSGRRKLKDSLKKNTRLFERKHKGKDWWEELKRKWGKEKIKELLL